MPCVRVGVAIAPPCPLPVCLRVLGVVVARVRGMLWLPVCPCASRSIRWFVTVSQLGQEPWRGVGASQAVCPLHHVPVSRCPRAWWQRGLGAFPPVSIAALSVCLPPLPAAHPARRCAQEPPCVGTARTVIPGVSQPQDSGAVEHPWVPGAHRDAGGCRV